MTALIPPTTRVRPAPTQDPCALSAAYSRLREARSDAELRETLDLLRDLLRKQNAARLDNPAQV